MATRFAEKMNVCVAQAHAEIDRLVSEGDDEGAWLIVQGLASQNREVSNEVV